MAMRVDLRLEPSSLGRAPRTSCSARVEASRTKRNLLSYCSMTLSSSSGLRERSMATSGRVVERGGSGLPGFGGERVAGEGVLEIAQDFLRPLLHALPTVAPGENDGRQGLARPGRIVVDNSIVIHRVTLDFPKRYS